MISWKFLCYHCNKNLNKTNKREKLKNESFERFYAIQRQNELITAEPTFINRLINYDKITMWKIFFSESIIISKIKIISWYCEKQSQLSKVNVQLKPTRNNKSEI